MSQCVKSYGHLCKTTHQMWSCHVTLASNSENFYFSPNSVLNFRKSYQIWGNWLKNKKVTGKKTHWGVETPPPPPPVLIGLKTKYKIYFSDDNRNITNKIVEKSASSQGLASWHFFPRSALLFHWKLISNYYWYSRFNFRARVFFNIFTSF